jgi:hypothetical protein
MGSEKELSFITISIFEWMIGQHLKTLNYMSGKHSQSESNETEFPIFLMEFGIYH